MFLNIKFPENVRVQIDKTPPTLDPVTARGVLWQAATERFLLVLPKVARYLVENGQQVTIQPYPESNETEIEYFWQGTPLAALLYQRNLLALHASAVSGPKGAVIFTGDSGTGKSALLVELLKRGWKMLSDDLTIIAFDEKGNLLVYPNISKIYLWPDSFEKFEINSPSYQSRRIALSMNGHTTSIPCILHSIYNLSISNQNHIEAELLNGVNHFNILPSLLYNNRIANVLMDKSVLFRFTTTISKNMGLNLLKRPMKTWSVKNLADYVEKTE